MEIRFYVDPESGQPHIHDHGVTEEEVRQLLLSPGDDFQGRRKARVKFGRTSAGRYLKVIYVPEQKRDRVFVITAYELEGKALKAFRRRQRRRRK